MASTEPLSRQTRGALSCNIGINLSGEGERTYWKRLSGLPRQFTLLTLLKSPQSPWRRQLGRELRAASEEKITLLLAAVSEDAQLRRQHMHLLSLDYLM